ncbi:hypothetical protein TWF694_004565 [Orbilia ellipsospora]|uniref:Uncharacterized protein n=1 Tax=Orbilia ellipsospora TaxID=2528407 RepID=A0AAV9WVI5_9PEZI
MPCAAPFIYTSDAQFRISRGNDPWANSTKVYVQKYLDHEDLMRYGIGARWITFVPSRLRNVTHQMKWLAEHPRVLYHIDLAG